jgi:hypothetical protein
MNSNAWSPMSLLRWGALALLLSQPFLYAEAANATPASIYVTQNGSSINRINRYNISDGSITTLVSTGLLNPDRIAVDVLGGDLYFSDNVSNAPTGEILRKDLSSGSPPATILSAARFGAEGAA